MNLPCLKVIDLLLILFVFFLHNAKLLMKQYNNIKKLALQGYKLALDGYGNGYANIKHLVELPFSLVRLDTSMVAQATDEGEKALLAGMIQMLKNIPLEVVVDGVDAKETKEMLASMGCDLMQGEFFKEQGSEKDSDSR